MSRNPKRGLSKSPSGKASSQSSRHRAKSRTSTALAQLGQSSHVGAVASSRRTMALSSHEQKFFSRSLALPTTGYPLRPKGGSVVMERKLRGIVGTGLYSAQHREDRPIAPGMDPKAVLRRLDRDGDEQHIKDKSDFAQSVDNNIKAPEFKAPTNTDTTTRLTYRLHDGPPFANGALHMGHFLNKALKDFANRYKLARGYQVDFYPGWDTHGLPIELKALEATMKNNVKQKKGNKTTETKQYIPDPSHPATAGVTVPEIPTTPEAPVQYRTLHGDVAWGMHTPSQYHPNAKVLQLREMASKFARNAIKHQMQSMKDWSLIADYENPYITMDPTYEAREALVLGGLISKGCLYRQLMPVHWSPSSRTALAESELEYKDIESTAVYVCMPIAYTGNESLGLHANPLIKHPVTGKLVPNPSALSLVIWTTTPWTLPANRAICVAPEGVYSHVQVQITTTTTIDGIVQQHSETKNCIVIGSMVDSLRETWENAHGLSVDHFKPRTVVSEDGQDAETSPFIRLGLETTTLGAYTTEEYGNQAVISKGKKAGTIQDMILSRTVNVNIIRDDIIGKNLDALEYLSPLAFDIPEYLSSDASRFIAVEPDTGKVKQVVTSDPGTSLGEDGLYTGENNTIYLPIHRVIPAEHVLTDAGSGCVHTAPAHGDEDFQVGLQHNIPIACPVDDKGEYYGYMNKLSGMEALGRGNGRVLDMVRSTGLLLHQEQYEHRYPHDWRTLKPIMFRATSQWFCRLDEAKETAKQSLEDVYITNDTARARLSAFIDSRDKWCISRQRSWGLPLPVFYSKAEEEVATPEQGQSPEKSSKTPIVTTNERDALYGLEITHSVSELFNALGSQAWWQLPSWRLLPHKYRGEVNPKYNNINLDDIVDHYLKHNGLEYHNIETSEINPNKNRMALLNAAMNEDGDDGEDGLLDPLKRITHVNGEPVVGLPDDYYLCPWTIGNDTVDVWLDSGSSWFSALAAKIQAGHMKHKEIIGDTSKTEAERVDLLFSAINDDKSIADLYLEGSDQHRGWFQSSLLLSSLLTKQSPFSTLHSHGFVVDEFGKKMSKSLGNGLEPDEVILQQGHGSDVLRVWAASVDVSKDAVMSKVVLQSAIDFVRKWRGVMRFAIGLMTVRPEIADKATVLQQLEAEDAAAKQAAASTGQQLTGTEPNPQHKKGKKKKRGDDSNTETQAVDENTPYEVTPWHFNPQTDLVPYKSLHILDKYLLHHLTLTLADVDQAFETYQVHKAIQSLRAFINGPLSSVFIDLSKDRLYAESATSHHRNSALTTLWYTATSLLRVMTPVTPHLTQEVFEYLPENIRQCIMVGLTNVSQDSDSEVELPSGAQRPITPTYVQDHPMNNSAAAAGWAEVKRNWKNDAIASQFETVSGVRAAANRCIEFFRQNANNPGSPLTKIGSSNEIDVTVVLTKPFKSTTGSGSDGTTNTDAEENDVDALYKTLVTATDLHELLMVASVNVQIRQQTQEEYTASQAQKQREEEERDQAQRENGDESLHNEESKPSSTSDTTTAVNVISHSDRHFVATKATISYKSLGTSSSNQDVVVDVLVSKSNGSKCPRCWRFSQTSTEMDALAHDTMQATSTNAPVAPHKLWSTHIPRATTAHQDPDDPLCQRCDNVCC